MLFFADTACRVPTLVCSNSLRCARPSLAKEGQLFRAIKTLPLEEGVPEGGRSWKNGGIFLRFLGGTMPAQKFYFTNTFLPSMM